MLLIALLAVFAWIAWRSRRAPYLSGTCCARQQWPPVDLVDGEPAGEAERLRVP